ncbi:MAG: tetratricopeptide repeat protein, partial [Verrucomicrobia bacterium]|nr:tetratricopeptide repeat protein [Verrucomicrobiota bacterium]
MDTKLQRSFVRGYLPWLVAAGALILFCATLNRSLSLVSVMGLARVAGWDWHPVAQAPLYFLLTLPIRWLPVSWQLLAGSAFSMICAILTLALLARSVALLPHDRTREQRLCDLGEHGLLNLSTGWLAPVLAVLVCALQLSFWEHATTVSGEMLDLLVFAYVIRCLLEYRLDHHASWISRLAFVYGLGYRFLVRTSLCGLAGLLLYLLLPLFHASTNLGGSFFETLRSNLGYQKMVLFSFRPYLVVLLSLTSFLPLLVIGIRWPASMGDINAVGYLASTLMIYLLHAGLFALCLYNFFDPPISPKALGAGSGVPMLTFYYLSALCVGYFCGFFLLLFGPAAARTPGQTNPIQKLIKTAVLLATWAAAIGVPACLCYQSVQHVLARNSNELDLYGRQMAASLPATGCVVLSDDPVRLYAVQAALRARADRYILLDTGAMTQKSYHAYLKRKYGTRLPESPATEAGSTAYPPAVLVEYLTRANSQNACYYLHPSFGYYFEQFYQVPHRVAYELKQYPNNTVEIPALSPGLIQEQETFWGKFDTEQLKDFKDKVSRYDKLKKGEITALWVASYYSRACNTWGVQLQANQQPDKAMIAFQRALDLNPYNACAFVNLEWSRHWKETGKLLERFSNEAMDKLKPYAGNWDLLLSVNGPVDEPTFRMELAQMMGRNGFSRQSAQQMQRLLAINPQDITAAIVLGNVYVQAGLPDRALKLVSQVRADPALAPKDSRHQLDLICIEAWVACANTNLSKAEELLRAAQDKYPQLDEGFFTLAQMYMIQAEQLRAQGKESEYLKNITNAANVFERQTKVQPNNVNALVNYGGVCAQLGDQTRALALLS